MHINSVLFSTFLVILRCYLLRLMHVFLVRFRRDAWGSGMIESCWELPPVVKGIRLAEGRPGPKVCPSYRLCVRLNLNFQFGFNLDISSARGCTEGKHKNAGNDFAKIELQVSIKTWLIRVLCLSKLLEARRLPRLKDALLPCWCLLNGVYRKWEKMSLLRNEWEKML